MSDLTLITEQIAQDKERFRALVNGDQGVVVQLEDRTSKSIAGIVNDAIQEVIENLPDAGVESVNGRSGAVELTANDVGLGMVNNTSDADKPISIATQNALDLKQDLLESGVNIKTVNGESLLGAGDLVIQGGGGGGGVSSLVFINNVLI